MTDLLIHSMSEFADIILGCLTAADAREIVEVGAEFGGMSQHLADHAGQRGGKLTSIDPAPKPAFLDWVATADHVRHLAQPSLEAMPGLADVDAWVIDGDHNYYTVAHELAIADQLSRRDGKPLLAFLHDVSWPCARRDTYYAPDRIPAEWCQPYSFEGGMTLDSADLIPGRGFRGGGQFAAALHEGGPRNGVLTAVEDFLASAHEEGRALSFAFVPAVFGLGVVFASDAPWSAAVTDLLRPFHDNPLLTRMEENRLRNYLAVIDWQDRTNAEAQKAA
ncbi:class I SAM-dependent methyltransferase [Sphingomonas sp.]|uniref:class I SAM-dependent methyltransferase n=1 Tax=Sphingomonas sp. TaxID=28214 RepID=UPI002EDB94B8